MFKKIFPNCFAFISPGEGSNCFLLKGEKEIALIDSSTEENRKPILSGLKATGIRPADVSLILHTHGHADHFGLNFLFPRARIAMHRADASKINLGGHEFACSQFFPGTRLPKISLFLEEDQEIDLGSLKLRIIHTPGHTEGSVCFYLESKKALFSGDTLFSAGFGRTDLPSGSGEKMAQSLKKLQKIAFSLLLPGHGPPLTGKGDIATALRESITTASTNAFL